MRPLLAAIALFFVTLPLAAADRSNTLTPREAADGWLLLFDGETTFGWKVEGEAKVEAGVLTLGGDRATTATFTSSFGNFELRLEREQLRGTNEARLVLDVGTEAGLEGRLARGGVGLGPALNQKGWNPAELRTELELGRGGRVRGRFTDAASGVSSEATLLFTVSSGRVRLGVEVPAGTAVALRGIKLRPLGLRPLFNGKDLSGWKKYEGDRARAKSEFIVTPEGWLHVRSGPGDLQTEGRWADFVLQAECRTNGDRLNSGIFFRCRPGEYQNGYEAQIHNGFANEKEYAVEEYDPQTHRLVGKRKVASAAVDYGTGAIYRRVPARKQAARDGEWFTLTVDAHGNHFATWVNGVQTVDWTDHRPPSDNARMGCRLEAGPVSLQGHDPTTDLDFRNLRIAELPAAAK